MSNVQTVQNIYAAFGRGDIPAILAHLAENIEWEYGMSNAGVPWLQPRKGRAEVPKFFQSLGALDFRQFEPKTLLEGRDIAVALIDLTVVVRATGCGRGGSENASSVNQDTPLMLPMVSQNR